MKIKTRLSEIFRDTLELEKVKNLDSISMDSVDDWDSLAHISLILNIETEFGIKIPMKQVPELNSFSLILEYLNSNKEFITL